ncbi:ribosomal-protein-alanine N-acetyltransferase [Ureibacillus xyleni]|uniref:Ribosomal-protein-alanine N-acetyltransferase n=1 Tax=Ureibacillus xyleni TaxID=614648 RepID=A0A285SC71_9BACL|nr:GNAT family N-acetyltransferase [Ureibacillus xyleni]SOC05318.1 ribosomal-protein-alanine N-acetyltransferase [Ureibacillus xyleni]
MSNKNIMYPSLETDRLKLQLFTLEDAEKVFLHFSDFHITEFMDIEPCSNLKEAEEIIQYHLDDEGCRWGLYEKESEQFIGTIGFHYLRKSEKFIAEVGFDLNKTYWGKGYISEALNEVITFGFSNMGLDIIDATVDPNNVRSIQLMKKFSFSVEPELKDNLLYFYLKNPR